MPYLLDSDVLISQRQDEPEALSLVEQLAPEGLAISIITYMEVYQGILRSPDPARAEAGLAAFLAGVPVVPFSLDAARRCAAMREHLAGQGTRVRSRALDLITAAIALEHGYTLVTRNRRDYEDIPGLTLFAPD
jgi:tRNA(fMet)-specific endonuclease VapC